METKLRTTASCLLRHMPGPSCANTALEKLERRWERVALTGKINCSGIASDLFDFIDSTHKQFTKMRHDLADTLAVETFRKTLQETTPLAHAIIDTLLRNLYERTADVSFLAADDAVVRFLDETLPAECRPTSEEMQFRLSRYRACYTVYSDIILVDTHEGIRAQLNTANIVNKNLLCGLIKQALCADGYVESYQPAAFMAHGGPTLCYAHAVRAPRDRRLLGALCLFFDLEGEMRLLFDALRPFAADGCLQLLDADNRVILSSSSENIPQASLVNGDDAAFCVTGGARPVLAVKRRSPGYQGYRGLPWQGQVLRNLTLAFTRTGEENVDEQLVRRAADFSARLVSVEEQAGEVLSDLILTAQNGEIMAARRLVSGAEVDSQAALSLPPVLKETGALGDMMRVEFQRATGELLQVVTASRLRDATFLASQAVDIMDRNLYERANDCRWWALSDVFRRELVKTSINPEVLSDVLDYINSQYTVYHNILLHDAAGNILACSRPAERDRYGSPLDAGIVHAALALKDSLQYSVSAFKPCGLYARNGVDLPTYCYCAAIFPPAGGIPVGGITLVFDAAPEFSHMLESTLQDKEGSTGLFMEADGTRVATWGATKKEHIAPTPPAQALALAPGDTFARLEEHQGTLRAVGWACSRGYREYKRDGVYSNTILARVSLPI